MGQFATPWQPRRLLVKHILQRLVSIQGSRIECCSCKYEEKISAGWNQKGNHANTLVTLASWTGDLDKNRRINSSLCITTQADFKGCTSKGFLCWWHMHSAAIIEVRQAKSKQETEQRGRRYLVSVRRSARHCQCPEMSENSLWTFEAESVGIWQCK